MQGLTWKTKETKFPFLQLWLTIEGERKRSPSLSPEKEMTKRSTPPWQGWTVTYFLSVTPRDPNMPFSTTLSSQLVRMRSKSAAEANCNHQMSLITVLSASWNYRSEVLFLCASPTAPSSNSHFLGGGLLRLREGTCRRVHHTLVTWVLFSSRPAKL